MRFSFLHTRRRRAGAIVAAAFVAITAVYAAAKLAFDDLDNQPIGFVAPLEFDNFDLSSGTSVAFRGDYVPATWDGDLVAERLNSDGSFAAQKWSARQQLLPTATSWDTGRKIYTMDDKGVPVAFRWSGASAISKDQQKLLGEDPKADPEGQKILNYLRGDASNELTSASSTGTYRYRYSKIGAVIHSRPYYWDHGTARRVYVGANDGMLHAFDADTGNEVFAYVPSMLFPKLKDLATNTNPFDPQYYVDGPLAIGKLPKSGGGETTLLVGGLGAGGIGLYALDISNPTPAAEDAASAKALVKWEINEDTKDFKDDIGHVMGPPQIVKLNDGRTVVLASNGPNSDKGEARLLVIDAATGELIESIETDDKNKDTNGLGAMAAVDLDGNGTVDAVYAGDLFGTLWKFDFSSAVPEKASVLYKPANPRPITAAPSVIANPAGGYIVNFGTGHTHDPASLTSTTTEYLYGVWDAPAATGTTVVDQTLTKHSVSGADGTIDVRTSSSNAVTYSGSTKGWRIALPAGERLVAGDTLTDAGRYTITTAVPNAGTSQGSWYMQVDALTGGSPSRPFFDLDGDGVVQTTGNGDRVVTGSGASQTAVPPVGKFLGTGVWSQPVLAQIDDTYDLPYFNHNSNLLLPATTTGTTTQTTTTQGGAGVSGGHFDYDIYYNCSFSGTGYSCGSSTHTHAYDDKYGVTGSNFLNASNPVYNLDKPMPSATAPRFKILIGNTRWSPAASLLVEGNATIGGVAKAVSLQHPTWSFPRSPGGFLAETEGGAPLTFTRADLAKLIWALPVDGFYSKEWIAGSGDVRSGLIPSATGCVRGNRGGGLGEGGAWMNGALVFQFVKDTTPDSAVMAAYPADAGGFLLKKDTASQANQIAQYTVFWHNGGCYGQPGWSKTATRETNVKSNNTSPPAGTGDPVGGFVITGGSTSTGGTTSGSSSRTISTSTTMYNGVEVLVTRDQADTGYRQIITRKSDNVVLNDTTSAVNEAVAGDRQRSDRPRTGRLSWKEIVR